MAYFEEALQATLKHEGGFIDDPLDAGGATNFGISLRFFTTLHDKATAADIKNLTVADASDIYRKHFWENNKYNLIACQAIANKVFDLSVNMGSLNANKCIQRSVRAASGRILLIDGIIGTQSLYAINMSQAALLLVALRAEAASYYRGLNNSIFEKGWLNRAYS